MSVKDDLKVGIIYNSIGKYSNLIITFLIQIVLSRLLTPVEFGIVAVVNVFLVFFQLLSDFGIGPAIIQSKDLDKEDINHIFSFSIYFSVVLAIGFSLSSKPISTFYDNNYLLTAIPMMSIALFFNSLMMVPQNLLLKEKNFKSVNTIQVIGSLFNGIVSIVFAYLGYSFYAIILGNIIRAFLQFILYICKTNLSFRLKISLTPLSKIYGFAKNQLFFNVINYFSRNLDSILIGRYMHSDQLGYYNKAYQLSLYPNTIFTSVISSAILPIFSSYQSDLEKMKMGYLNIARVLANIGIPLSVFLFFTSEDIIVFLYGSQWTKSALAFQILSVSIWIQMLQSTTGGFFQSVNRTDLLLLSGILSTIVNITGIIVGVYLGSIYWVSTIIVITFFFNFFQTNYLLLRKALKSPVLDFYIVLLKPLVIGILELVIFIAMPEINFGSFLNVLVKFLIFLANLFVGLLITKQFYELKNLIKYNSN